MNEDFNIATNSHEIFQILWSFSFQELGEVEMLRDILSGWEIVTSQKDLKTRLENCNINSKYCQTPNLGIR